jgi:hypothetical protein
LRRAEFREVGELISMSAEVIWPSPLVQAVAEHSVCAIIFDE